MSSTNTTPRLAEPVDDEPVVDDLVVAVHGRLEDAHHPREGLDRHLDPGAEAAGLGEQHLFDGHVTRLMVEPGSACRRSAAPSGPVDSRPCRPPVWWRSRPVPRRPPLGSLPATRSSASTVRRCATSSSTSCRPTSRVVELELRRGGLERAGLGREARRRAARARARERGLRPGAHLRQPLPVLLHLPAAGRDAPQPLPQGRRLPAVVPLRELHDADPLHRGRPRACRHRTPQPALREHPRDRPRPARPAAAQPARARRASAGSPRCSTPASRCTVRSSCAPASTTATRSTTRCSASSTGSRASRPSVSSRSASAPTRPSPTCGRTPRPRPVACSTPSRRGRRGSSPRSAAGSCSQPTSTTCSPSGRSPAIDEYDGLPAARERHRHGARVRRRGAAGDRRRRRVDGAIGTARGFFAWVDGAPADGLPRADACAARRIAAARR